MKLQRSGLLAEGRFHDGPARERHVPAKMLGTYFVYLRGRACVWEEGSYDVSLAALAVLTVVSEGPRRARRPAAGPTPYAIDATPGRCRNVRRGLVPHPPQPAGPVPHVPGARLVAPVDRVGARPLEG